MATAHLPRTTDCLKSAKWRSHCLFLDSEPEVVTQPPRSGFALDGTKKNCYTAVNDEKQSVLEFFAVGDQPTAVLFRAVKGGDSLPQTKISAIFKVHLSLFLCPVFS